MYAIALLTSVLLASTAVAAPSRLAQRVAARRSGTHLTRPLQVVDSSFTSNSSHPQYSSNWAGAVYDSYPSGSFTAVTGTFTVPTPSAGSGSNDSYSASAWVGIDGDTCSTAILQTGVDFTTSGGSVSYDAWYEWYPDYAYDFSGISFSAGDVVTVTVTAASTTSGTAVIENTTTGQRVSQDITSSSALCEENAEWIVEDYEENGGLVPFANFGTVTFSGAAATTSSGSVGPGNATIIDIQQSGTTYTDVSVDSSSVTVKYV
ncbi:peptidase A4 family-domain-containing protein [Rhodofomes roseus]|uniref:Peptidase A4 family-domain-containing protein n=1 Tax=Rhodofomes roseus TaxID=34475 RepID=A0ABQ8KG05_9APHY|nr:peptidase A4 family-domain-containing protein [Rhodofomes roseus]KAH9836726.1 peptidase A4 family-domain-containing protein [Rhodofomes roseus]